MSIEARAVDSDNFVRTGVPGVDELLDAKGIPKGNTIFVLGSPGSGKTIFALQYLVAGATQYRENGVYISLDEDISHIRSNSRTVGLDVESLEKQGKLALIDASPLRLSPPQIKVGEFAIGKREFTLVSLMDILKKQVQKIQAKRLVIDPIVALSLQYPDRVERRTALLDLMQVIAQIGCTSLLVTELTESGIDRTYQFEEYLAQGVIIMRRLQNPGGVVRFFGVEKMRGLNHDDQPHPYKIEQGGLVVYPDEIAL